MRFFDKLKLAFLEFKIEKKECFISIILQFCMFTCTIFLLVFSYNIDNIGDCFLRNIYKDGYTFQLIGFKSEEELTELGFYDIVLSDDFYSAKINSISGLWLKKVVAAFQNKDIWNQDVDNFIITIGIAQIIFFSLSMIMLIVMLNCISNSFDLKLVKRQNYIIQLNQLGCSKKNILSIFIVYFSYRNLVALVASFFAINSIIEKLQSYINNVLYIRYGIKQFEFYNYIILYIIFSFVMKIKFNKHYRRKRQNECL